MVTHAQRQATPAVLQTQAMPRLQCFCVPVQLIQALDMQVQLVNPILLDTGRAPVAAMLLHCTMKFCWPCSAGT